MQWLNPLLRRLMCVLTLSVLSEMMVLPCSAQWSYSNCASFVPASDSSPSSLYNKIITAGGPVDVSIVAPCAMTNRFYLIFHLNDLRNNADINGKTNVDILVRGVQYTGSSAGTTNALSFLPGSAVLPPQHISVSITIQDCRFQIQSVSTASAFQFNAIVFSITTLPTGSRISVINANLSFSDSAIGDFKARLVYTSETIVFESASSLLITGARLTAISARPQDALKSTTLDIFRAKLTISLRQDTTFNIVDSHVAALVQNGGEFSSTFSVSVCAFSALLVENNASLRIRSASATFQNTSASGITTSGAEASTVSGQILSSSSTTTIKEQGSILVDNCSVVVDAVKSSGWLSAKVFFAVSTITVTSTATFTIASSSVVIRNGCRTRSTDGIVASIANIYSSLTINNGLFVLDRSEATIRDAVAINGRVYAHGLWTYNGVTLANNATLRVAGSRLVVTRAEWQLNTLGRTGTVAILSIPKLTLSTTSVLEIDGTSAWLVNSSAATGSSLQSVDALNVISNELDINNATLRITNTTVGADGCNCAETDGAFWARLVAVPSGAWTMTNGSVAAIENSTAVLASVSCGSAASISCGVRAAAIGATSGTGDVVAVGDRSTLRVRAVNLTAVDASSSVVAVAIVATDGNVQVSGQSAVEITRCTVAVRRTTGGVTAGRIASASVLGQASPVYVPDAFNVSGASRGRFCGNALAVPAAAGGTSQSVFASNVTIHVSGDSTLDNTTSCDGAHRPRTATAPPTATRTPRLTHTRSRALTRSAPTASPSRSPPHPSATNSARVTATASRAGTSTSSLSPTHPPQSSTPTVPTSQTVTLTGRTEHTAPSVTHMTTLSRTAAPSDSRSPSRSPSQTAPSPSATVVTQYPDTPSATATTTPSATASLSGTTRTMPSGSPSPQTPTPTAPTPRSSASPTVDHTSSRTSAPSTTRSAAASATGTATATAERPATASRSASNASTHTRTMPVPVPAPTLPPVAEAVPVGVRATASTVAAALVVVAAADAQAQGLLQLSRCAREARGGAAPPAGAYRVLSPTATADTCDGVLQGQAIIVGAAVMLGGLAVAVFAAWARCRGLPAAGDRPWAWALGAARCPTTVVTAAVFVQSGVVVCGAELAAAGRAAGFVALVAAAAVVAGPVALAWRLGAREYHALDAPLVLCGWRAPAAVLLPRGELCDPDGGPDALPLVRMLGGVVGPWRRPQPWWPLLTQASVLALLPAVAASGQACVALHGTSAGLFGLCAAGILVARPRRVLLADVLHAAALAVNGAAVAATGARLAAIGDAGRVDAAGTAIAVLGTAQLVLTAVRLAHAVLAAAAQRLFHERLATIPRHHRWSYRWAGGARPQPPASTLPLPLCLSMLPDTPQMSNSGSWDEDVELPQLPRTDPPHSDAMGADTDLWGDTTPGSPAPTAAAEDASVSTLSTPAGSPPRRTARPGGPSHGMPRVSRLEASDAATADEVDTYFSTVDVYTGRRRLTATAPKSAPPPPQKHSRQQPQHARKGFSGPVIEDVF